MERVVAQSMITVNSPHMTMVNESVIILGLTQEFSSDDSKSLWSSRGRSREILHFGLIFLDDT